MVNDQLRNEYSVSSDGWLGTSFIPDELVLKTNLIGTEEMVRERLRTYQAAGVNTLRVEPDGATLDERLANLGKLIELVREVEVLPMTQ